MRDPALMKQMRSTMTRELRQELGVIGMLKLWWRMKGETNRMSKHDWSALRDRGLTDQGFLDYLVQHIGAMKALADMFGMERA